jgi:hypothetical protein
VMQRRTGDLLGSIEVGVDVDKPHRPRGTERLQDRERYRVIAADRERDDLGRMQLGVEITNFVDDRLEIETRLPSERRRCR